MIRFIIVALIAIAAFWCYNNLDFSGFTKNVGQSIQNEKTIKAVRGTRTINQEQEKNALDGNY